jgi:UDP-N-acetylglucosamine 2-epimerase (non-hydrolysing)
LANCKVAVFVGTRPEIIKLQPVVKELKSRSTIDSLFIHTGQHYDYNMSSIFIKELDLPTPNLFLNVKSNLPGVQLARIIARSEQAIRKLKPTVILVQGDTNSTLGVALAAAKMKLPLGHIEAGCRSFDRSMPEELNRVLVADLATHHFTPTENCSQNLLREGIAKESVYLTGHPIVDLLEKIGKSIDDSAIKKYGLTSDEYYLVTLHREENVDNAKRLESILKAIYSISERNKVIFPIHPHTKKNVRKYRLTRYLQKSIVIEPVGYVDGLAMIRNAFSVLTDSGGIQQEAAIMGTPCLTVRTKTEWVETVSEGVNFLAGYETEKILQTVAQINEDWALIKNKFKRFHYLFGKPPISSKIVDIVETISSIR